MRGLSNPSSPVTTAPTSPNTAAPMNGNSAPEAEGFTPPPPEMESLTPDNPATMAGDAAGLEGTHNGLAGPESVAEQLALSGLDSASAGLGLPAHDANAAAEAFLASLPMPAALHPS
ncbi:hypothetical protein LTR53_019890, partial [Teratosphaeriaceae sp. CCFEE 6253]